MQFIDLQAQLNEMRGNIESRINRVLDHGQFIMGPEVKELESQLADYVGVKHCISCANGTDALQLSLMCRQIGLGDIVFTTAFTFFATAEVISLVGATPYFVDIDPTTFNICSQSLSAAIEDARARQLGTPKAVIAVDLFGLPANYRALEPLCDNYDLILIEDAAQGFGGHIDGKRAGSFGAMATTSFFPAKPLGCYGDGGALFTSNDEIADIARSLRIHGKGQHKYDNVRIGLNSRLDTIQAAILLEKLDYFDSELAHRQRISEIYATLATPDWQTPMVSAGYYSSWAQYTIVSTRHSRDDVMRYLQQKGIPSAVYYLKPLNEQSAFNHCLSAPTPNTKIASKSVFSLPMSGYVNPDDAQRVVETLLNY